MPALEQLQEPNRTQDTARSAEDMLLEFLRDYDAPCPVCGYNLRALTRPICPECRQHLVLSVGVTHLRLGWFLVTLAPGAFSGIAAFFVLLPILGRVLFGDGRWTPALIVLDLFGWSSATAAIVLARKRNRFLALPRGSQRLWAFFTWAVHVSALVMFILIGRFYLS